MWRYDGGGVLIAVWRVGSGTKGVLIAVWRVGGGMKGVSMAVGCVDSSVAF